MLPQNWTTVIPSPPLHYPIPPPIQRASKGHPKGIREDQEGIDTLSIRRPKCCLKVGPKLPLPSSPLHLSPPLQRASEGTERASTPHPEDLQSAASKLDQRYPLPSSPLPHSPSYPKGMQRASKRHPQGIQRASKGHPKGAQRASKETRRHPKGIRRHREGIDSLPIGHPKCCLKVGPQSRRSCLCTPPPICRCRVYSADLSVQCSGNEKFIFEIPQGREKGTVVKKRLFLEGRDLHGCVHTGVCSASPHRGRPPPPDVNVASKGVQTPCKINTSCCAARTRRSFRASMCEDMLGVPADVVQKVEAEVSCGCL